MNAEEKLKELIEEIGFEDYGVCRASDLSVRADVRDMCASGKCRMYGHNWACPPAIGDIEQYQKLIDARQTCYVVQTVRELEDEFDGETMMDAEREQKARVLKLSKRLAAEDIDALTLAAGTCTICEKCTYPDEPCRHPENRLVSMEAAGLMVYQVCEVAGVPYNHGPLTIAYSSAVLL